MCSGIIVDYLYPLPLFCDYTETTTCMKLAGLCFQGEFRRDD